MLQLVYARHRTGRERLGEENEEARCGDRGISRGIGPSGA